MNLLIIILITLFFFVLSVIGIAMSCYYYTEAYTEKSCNVVMTASSEIPATVKEVSFLSDPDENLQSLALNHICNNLKLNVIENADTVLAKGGDYDSFSPDFFHELESKLKENKKIIWFPISLSENSDITKLRNIVKYDNITILLRDNKSLNVLEQKFSQNPNMKHVMDATFEIDKSAIPTDFISEDDFGKLYIFNFESRPVLKEMFSEVENNDNLLKIRDNNYPQWANLLQGISEYSTVYTNIPQVANAACLLDKTVFMFPGNDFSTMKEAGGYSNKPVNFINIDDPSFLMRTYLTDSYVTTLDDPISRKRLHEFQEKQKEFQLPTSQINPALHYGIHNKEIRERFPFIDETTGHFRKRPGAYGLAASFCQFLETVIEKHGNETDDYTVMWFEDDAIPASNKSLFNGELALALSTIPSEGNDVYFFSRNDYCRGCDPVPEWTRSGSRQYGTPSVLFTIGACKSILHHLQNHGLAEPIDKLITTLNKKNVITSWDWSGNACRENPMFCGLFKQFEVYCERDGVVQKRSDRIYSTMDEQVNADSRRSPPEDAIISYGKLQQQSKHL